MHTPTLRKTHKKKFQKWPKKLNTEDYLSKIGCIRKRMRLIISTKRHHHEIRDKYQAQGFNKIFVNKAAVLKKQ